MNFLKKIFSTATAIAFTLLALQACGSEDNEDQNNGTDMESVYVIPSNVFKNGIPKNYAGCSITTNATGQVVHIEDNGRQVDFDYKLVESGTGKGANCVMTINDEDGSKYILYLQLNKNGFCTHCDEVEMWRGETENETWDFTYNSAGQLLSMKRSEGGKEQTTMTYNNGNITKVCTISEEDSEKETSNYIISYTSEDVKSPMENKGCIMLFDNTLGIDTDEMFYAYMAGMLGKATTHLPQSCTDVEENYTETFKWEINPNFLPVKLTFSDMHDFISFTW